MLAVNVINNEPTQGDMFKQHERPGYAASDQSIKQTMVDKKNTRTIKVASVFFFDLFEKML